MLPEVVPIEIFINTSLGCATCAKRTIGSFKGTDKVLKKQFEDARKEVGAYSKSNDIGLAKKA